MTTLTPFRSFFSSPSESLFSRMDAPLDRLWRRFLQWENVGNEIWNPPANVVERPDSYQIKVELPGISRSDIHVTLSDNILSVRGEKRAETTSEGETCRCQEVNYGTFERTMSLPNAAEQDVDAQFQNGVLSITVKKRKESRAKEIAVKGS
jgi:HSP20 family protein